MWTWGIIILIMLSLIGSMMWAMPTPREKAQAMVRSKARTLGLQVQMVRLTAPRATGEAEAEEYERAAYRYLRHGLSAVQRERLQPWQLFRIHSLANEGLPEGWSWKQGERMLSQEQLDVLAEVLPTLPVDVVALESTSLYITAFWGERGGIEGVEKIRAALQRVSDRSF
uniref:hypothetical protein n=1 Tax=Marinobacterium profundum TaxID=1714300 RepID=UPI000833B80C|nr:hypothetical protein [Marinobacterium profundum]